MSAIWNEGGSRRVLVLTGTDMHPFDRVCAWADARARAHPDEQVLVQHGFTAAPDVARAVQLLTPDELGAALAGADAVVTHGGPGTISTVRAAGHLPVVLPRDPALGEHVDEHQVRFAAWAGARGLGRVVDDIALLDAAVDDARRGELTDALGPTGLEQSLDALADGVRALSRGRAARRSWPLARRRRWMPR